MLKRKENKKKAFEIARRMLSKGKDIQEIMDFTDLSEEAIKNLESK